MRTTLAVIISFLILNCCQAQVNECNCYAYFNWDTINKLGLKKDQFYSKISKLDTTDDDGCDAIVEIKKDSVGYFLVVPFPDIPAKKQPAVWIKNMGQLIVALF